MQNFVCASSISLQSNHADVACVKRHQFMSFNETSLKEEMHFINLRLIGYDCL